MPSVTPMLRPLEAIPVEKEGQQLVVLRDPWRFQPNNLTVSLPAYLLMTLMDGKRTIPEICGHFAEQYKGNLGQEELEKFVLELDENGLLFGRHFDAMRERALTEFAKAPLRKAAHAGSAYADDPEELKAQLDGFFAEAEKEAPQEVGKKITGLIAPHIDPRVGGITAAKAFAALKAAPQKPDLFVIFGTAHQPSEALFLLTEKDFETPLGRVETDKELTAALRKSLGDKPFEEEYLHKYEHSIEFQLPFIQHMYGPDRSFRILPVLVGSFQEYIVTNQLPSADEAFLQFTNALQRALKDQGKSACFIAGADLSHVGLKFGDEEGLDAAFIDPILEEDQEMVAHLARNDKEGFFRQLQCSGDRQKVCGLPPIYTALHFLSPENAGQLCGYAKHTEAETQSLVSFAGCVYTG